MPGPEEQPGDTVMHPQSSWTPSLPSRGLQCVDAQLGHHQDTPQASATAHQEPLPATCRILASGSISNLRRWVSPDTPLDKSNIHIKESVQSHTPPRAPCAPASLACRFSHPRPFALAVPSARHALPPDLEPAGFSVFFTPVTPNVPPSGGRS